MKTKSQIPTKEKIFNVSLDLFSKKGYDNVSIREIAKHVGIKESSIYNHYSKKENILETIFEYYKKNMIETKTYYENNLDTKTHCQIKTNFNNINIMKGYHRGSQAIKNQWKEPKMRKILRLMIIELYHNEKIRKFFTEELINRPIAQWTSFYQGLINEKIIEEANPKKLAERYHKYAIFLLFELMLLKVEEDTSDSTIDKMFDELFDEVESHFNLVLNSVLLKKE